MSEDVGYGDCRDTCVQYAIESDFACEGCAAEMDNECPEEDFFPEMYDQGGM